MKIKNIWIPCILIVLILIFPQPVANLYLRLDFKEIAGDKVQLYYATQSSGFSEEQSIVSAVDLEKKQVSFCLDGNLHNQLTGLRLDFPTNEIIYIKNITLSSAGVIQKQYDPVHFFKEGNIADSNDVEIVLIEPTRNTAVATGAEDPFVVLAPQAVADIDAGYSSYWMTKIMLSILVVAGYFLYHKRIFKIDTPNI